MRTNIKKALAVLLTLVMLCGLLPMGMLSVSAATTVFSADFENGSVSGWYTSGSGAMSAVSTSELPVANSACGSYVLKKVQPTGEYSWQEYQTGFTVKTNTDYVVTVDVLTTSNNWPIQAFVSSSTWISTILGQSEQVKCPSSAWTTLTFEFNSGNNTKLYPSVKSAWENTTLYVDNFTIVEKEAEPEVPAGGNLIVNGDFEAGTDGALPTGWAVYDASYPSLTTTAQAHAGTKAAALSKRTQRFVLYQDVQVTANTDYTVTFYYKFTTTSSSQGAFNYTFGAYDTSSKGNLSGSGGTLIDSTAGEVNTDYHNGSWTQMTYTFNSGSATTVRMAFSSNTSSYETADAAFAFVDDVVMIGETGSTEPEVPVGNNLVTNGDFEDSSNGWKVGTGGSVVTGGYTGSAFQMSNPAAWSEVGYQEVAVEANETYTLTWRSKRVSGTGVFNMELAKAPYDGTKPTVTAVTNQTWMNDTSGNWIDHKVTIKMTDANGNGITKIMIKLTTEASNAGVILIDDIVLTKNLVASFDGYIYNGDFEVGNIDHWTSHNGTTASTAAKYSGNYGAYLESNGSWGGIMSQATVNVVAGKTYIVSYYIKVTDKAIGIQIKDGTTSSGSLLTSKTHNASSDWQLTTFEVTPTQNGLFINFHGSGGESADPNNIGKAYVDNIKVELKGGNPKDKVTYGGSSVRDESATETATGKGLAFQFKVAAIEGVKNYDNTYEQSSGKIALGDIKYTLVRMGAVMTNNATVGQNANNFTLDAVNGTKVIDIPATYLNGADAESLSFAVRILDIPDRHIGTAIYARPYYVYLENGEEVIVYGDTRSNNYAKAANISTADKSSIKILSIGHSFSKDVMVTNLYNMFKEGGYEEVVIGYLYMAGCSMPKHLYNIEHSLAQYEYAKNSTGSWVTKNNVTALSALKEEDWDFVTVQSSPDYIGGQTISSITLGVNSEGDKIEGINQTEYEAMDEITDWILANATNADVKIDYHMIWSFSQGCDLWSGAYHKDPATNKYSQIVMYNNIVNITQEKVQNHEDINRIIPSATAIQNARTSFMGDNFNMPDATQGGSDGYHLNDDGDYVAALTWYCHYSGDNANIMAGYTGVLSADEFLAVAEAVNNAIDIPFAVTESSYTE